MQKGLLIITTLIGLACSTVPKGFGKDVTGGKGGEVVYPTTIDELRYYVCTQTSKGNCVDDTPRIIVLNQTFDFRGTLGHVTELGCIHTDCTGRIGPHQVGLNVSSYCNGREPTMVTYDAAGTDGTLLVGSNKSIIGVGTNGRILGTGLMLKNVVSNIIIQNIAITDINTDVVWGGDAIVVQNAKRVWIDHCYFANIGRQMIATRGDEEPLQVTISHNIFDGNTIPSSTCNKQHYWVFLFNGDGDTVSVYGNYIYETSGRGPNAKGSRSIVHLVNNYYVNLTREGAVAAHGSGAFILVEGNAFWNVSNPVYQSTTNGNVYGAIEDASLCSWYIERDCVGNSLVQCTNNEIPTETSVLEVFKSLSDYLITPRPASEVPAWVLANAGPGKIEDLSSENEASALRGVSDPAEPRTILNSTLEEKSHEERPGSSQIEDQVEDQDEERSDGEDEYEGEDEEEEQDEYEDELRAMAESHEAMSKDENNTGSNSSRAVSTSAKDEDKFKMMKMFESREKSVEDGSDETEASNETIDDSIFKEKDVEVAQLLKYKNMRRVNEELEKRVEQKIKRVPTVKKELSTQKEINSGNETETQKRFDTKDIFHRMNDELKKSYQITSEPSTYVKEESQDKSTEKPGEKIYYEKSVPQTKIREDTKFEDLESSSETPRKVDKRQEAVLRDLEAYLRAEYAAEQKQEEQKLQELGAQEGALAESLLKLLVKLAENPRRWERVHRLLMDVEGGLELSRRALEAHKRGLDLNTMITTSTSTTTISPMSSTPKKNRKKLKKKKKKKPRHHRYPISTTAIASTPSLLTTTETPWLTTPMEWRLVAERLIGPPWLWNLQNDPNIAKVRFSSNPRLTPSPTREFGQQVLDNKQREEHKALNTERQALMLESAREYTQPRHLHYGKVNTHQTLVPHRESVSGYVTERENSRIRDYDPPERSYQRYGQYNPPREFSRGRSREEEFIPPESYAQNHEYRPPSLEYAASKSWQDTAQFKYGRPSWKMEDRSVESGKWGWRETGDLKLWPQVDDSRPWQSNRDYWPHLEGDPDKTRSPQRGHIEQQPWETVVGVASSWPGKPSSPWLPTDKNKGYYRDEPSWDKGKNRSELSRDALKQSKDNDKGIVPKVTMKSWNSLTSDPATWPFKFPGAKPWPKDKNGKSYNPNADLVRKLGLDKQGRLLSDKESTSDFKSYQSSNTKYNAVKISKDVAPKVQESLKQPVSWPLKMTPGKQWPLKPSKDYNPDVDLVKALTLEDNPRPWTGNVDTNRKAWQEKSAISPKIQSVGAWVMPADQSTWKPYNLKALDSYNRDVEDAGRRWPTSVSESQRTWPPKPEDRPWPSKITDNWNNFGKSSPPGTWPKWKQFAYHRVTAMPVMNTGSSMDGARSRNAFIAMSAVSPKYSGNQWRKNDIEETPVQQSIAGSTDPDHPSSQLHADVEPAIYTWKKDVAPIKRNSTDPLEDQLEELRRAASWSHTENVNNIKKQLNAISDASVSLVSHLASSVPSNSSSGTHAGRLITEMNNRINLQTNEGQEDKELSKK